MLILTSPSFVIKSINALKLYKEALFFRKNLEALSYALKLAAQFIHSKVNPFCSLVEASSNCP